MEIGFVIKTNLSVINKELSMRSDGENGMETLKIFSIKASVSSNYQPENEVSPKGGFCKVCV
jgi:hypothetical protein